MFLRKVQKKFRKAKNILEDLSNKHKPLLLISDQYQVLHQWLLERSDYISSHNKSNGMNGKGFSVTQAKPLSATSIWYYKTVHSGRFKST